MLNSWNASASVVVEASAAAASASVAAVAIASGLTSVPSLYASVCSAASASSLLDVKSVSTLSLVPIVMIATRSASVISSLTHSRESSTARCTSSGCIELTSSRMAIIRRFITPAATSVAGATGSGVVDVALAARAASARTLSSKPSRSWTSAAPAGAAPLISWNENVSTLCGLPSSVTMKSLAVRPRTMFPAESRTTTSTETMLTPAELSNRGAWAGGAAGCCCCADGLVAPAARARTSATTMNRCT